MSVMPGRLPPTLLMMRCRALPMQALARLPLPKVLVPALMPSRLTMGPLTMTSTESGLVVVATPRRSNSGWLTASTAATSKGMCLGSHPAMTALTAIFPTVATPSSGGSVAMGKSSGRSYPASMALTRSGVGGTSGSPSPQPRARNRALNASSPSPAASMVSVSARGKSTAVPDEEARMVSTYTPSSLCPAGLQTVRLAACAGGMRNNPAANKKERMMRMTVPSERFLWAFVEARFGIVPNAPNGASREDEPLRPDAGSGPGYAKTPTARGDPGCWRTACARSENRAGAPVKRAPALRVIRRSSRKRASGPAGKAPRTGTACPARRRRSS